MKPMYNRRDPAQFNPPCMPCICRNK